MNKVSVFLPTRSGSERVVNKNTKRFAGVEGGLLAIKLGQLVKCDNIDEIVLSTNDEKSIEIAENFKVISTKLKVILRPNELALSTTDLVDLVNYVPTICNNEHILWTHVTSPLVDTLDYSYAIELYLKNINEGYDSLMSVKAIQNFMWSEEENRVTNKQQDDDKKWPRTQDLIKMYEVNSAVFIAPKRVYKIEKDRVGIKPFLLEQNQIQSTDVDCEEDFKLAEILYEKFKYN
ncbi:hypothetical protein [Nonlabens sp.]|uniref:acylneuraminate cytidylyltransferase family protein n=1 Tax=Nonlabens sp. TaxID=1888209 RepID=UPI001BCE51C6|nr:hypothetical protein [Nonlabens sp.]